MPSYNEPLTSERAGVVADAEAAVRSLNDHARPALRPLARLLLRTESIASCKVEGLQVDARSLAKAKTRGQPQGGTQSQLTAPTGVA